MAQLHSHERNRVQSLRRCRGRTRLPQQPFLMACHFRPYGGLPSSVSRGGPRITSVGLGLANSAVELRFARKHALRLYTFTRHFD